MSNTRWTVDQDSELNKITLTVETTDPQMVGLIAEASARHGISLLRELAGEGSDDQFESEPEFEPEFERTDDPAEVT
jgi:hypothetical protein